MACIEHQVIFPDTKGPDDRTLVCYSKAETAEFLHVPPRQVDGLIRRGKLPALRVGRHVRIPRWSLEKYVASAAPPGDVEEGSRE